MTAVQDLDAAAAGHPEPPPAARPTPEPQACDYCDAPIMWLTSSTGRRMPVDRDPTDDGNILIKGAHAGVLGKAQADAARAFGEQLHRHHVTTCPHASCWNRGARRGGGSR